jgi:hypothetical protein
VAVVHGKEQPLMRFLKSKQAFQSSEGDAFATRLTAISARGKLERSCHSVAQVPDAPGQIRQVFWTPEEAATANHE